MSHIFICVRQPGGLRYIEKLVKKNTNKVILAAPKNILNLSQELDCLKIEDVECSQNSLLDLNNRFKIDKLLTSVCYREEKSFNFEKECLKFFKKKKIKTLQFFDTSYDFKKKLIQTNGNHIFPDSFLFIDNKSLLDFKKEIKNNFEYHIVGHPVFEDIQLLQYKFDKSSIAFINQPIRYDIGNRLNFDEKFVWNELKVILKKNNNNIKSIFYKPHPREKIQKKQNDNKLLINNLNKFNGIIVGMFSSLMIELFLKGKYVISLQPSKLSNFCYLSSRNFIKKVNCAEDLIQTANLFNKNENLLKVKKLKEVFSKSTYRLEKALN